MNLTYNIKYNIGDLVNEIDKKTGKVVTGTVVRIEIIVHSEDLQIIYIVLDNGIKIEIGFKKP